MLKNARSTMPVNSTSLLKARLAAARNFREATEKAISVGLYQGPGNGGHIPTDFSLPPAFRKRQTFFTESSGQCSKRCVCHETIKERLGAIQHDALGGSASQNNTFSSAI